MSGSNIYMYDCNPDSRRARGRLAVQLGSRQLREVFFRLPDCASSKNKGVTVQPILMECPPPCLPWRPLNFNIPALPARPSFAAIALKHTSQQVSQHLLQHYETLARAVEVEGAEAPLPQIQTEGR
jgi:hypothetical protein